jgi:hypothetical protein
VKPEDLELKDGYACFRPVGETTPLGFLALLEEAMNACRALGATRFLADLRGLSHPPLTTIDRFEINERMSRFWDRGIRVSALVRPDQGDATRFGLEVARNRGLVYHVSTDEAQAVASLFAEGP